MGTTMCWSLASLQTRHQWWQIDDDLMLCQWETTTMRTQVWACGIGAWQVWSMNALGARGAWVRGRSCRLWSHVSDAHSRRCWNEHAALSRTHDATGGGGMAQHHQSETPFRTCLGTINCPLVSTSGSLTNPGDQTEHTMCDDQ
jgi:hypothetical protein